MLTVENIQFPQNRVCEYILYFFDDLDDLILHDWAEKSYWIDVL